MITNDKLKIAGKEYDSRLLHCFGNDETHKLSSEQALKLIATSGTGFLTIYTQNSLSIKDVGDLPMGYGGLTYKEIEMELINKDLTILVNTNHAVTVEDAVAKAEHVSELTGSKMIKLEVLNKELTRPVTLEVLKAAKELLAKGYQVMPFITRDIYAIKQAEAMGCCAVRVLMNDICSGRGLHGEGFWRSLVGEVDIPIIAEGGVRDPIDSFRVMAAGMDATLINTPLFKTNNPVLLMEATREAVKAGRLVYLASLEEI